MTTLPTTINDFGKASHGLMFLAALLFSSLSFPQDKTSAPWVGTTLKGAPCLGGGQGHGPFDYTQRSFYANNLEIVERFHFTPSVEQLTKGASGSIPADINYTLGAWPNHHRALNSISNYAIGNYDKSRPPVVPVECYFQRAIHFSPHDSTARMLYGIYLHKIGENELALKYYREAERISPHNTQNQYNLGLLLVDLGRYDEARRYANIVYARNFPLTGLKDRLANRSQPPFDSESELRE